MDEFLENLKIAEKAWIEAKKIADKLVKPGNKFLDVAESVENKIREICDIGFPINLSRNNEAAHYSPKEDTIDTFNEGDLVKVDIGTQSEGYIVDAAYSIDLSKNGAHKDLCEASKQALNNAEKYVKEKKSNSEFGELGAIIEKTIKSYGYKPIYNLTGHSIERYNLHSGKSILNYASGNKNKVGYGSFAIEPFATDGSGFVKNGSFCSIYSYSNSKTRLPYARKLIEEAKKYRIPLSERWIGKDVGPIQKKLAMNNLISNNCLIKHPILLDQKGSFVSQHEKTFYIDKEDKVHVFPNIEY